MDEGERQGALADVPEELLSALWEGWRRALRCKVELLTRLLTLLALHVIHEFRLYDKDNDGLCRSTCISSGGPSVLGQLCPPPARAASHVLAAKQTSQTRKSHYSVLGQARKRSSCSHLAVPRGTLCLLWATPGPSPGASSPLPSHQTWVMCCGLQGHEDLGMELAGSGGLTTLVIDMAVMKLDFRILGGTHASWWGVSSSSRDLEVSVSLLAVKYTRCVIHEGNRFRAIPRTEQLCTQRCWH